MDSVEYLLSPGDLLWVRAGHVQEWQWFVANASNIDGRQAQGRCRDHCAF